MTSLDIAKARELSGITTGAGFGGDLSPIVLPVEVHAEATDTTTGVWFNLKDLFNFGRQFFSVVSVGGAALIRTYETPLSPEEVSERIKKEIDTVGAFYYLLPSKRGREFVGNVSSQKFCLHVRHGGRASFAPRLIGRIESTPTGSRVVVDMRVDPLVRRLVVLVLAGAVLSAVVPYLLTGSSPLAEGAGVIALGTLLIYLISLPAGRREGQRLQEFMDRLFLVSPPA